MICSGCFIISSASSSLPETVVTFRFVVLPQIQLQPHCFLEHDAWNLGYAILKNEVRQSITSIDLSGHPTDSLVDRLISS